MQPSKTAIPGNKAGYYGDVRRTMRIALQALGICPETTELTIAFMPEGRNNLPTKRLDVGTFDALQHTLIGEQRDGYGLAMQILGNLIVLDFDGPDATYDRSSFPILPRLVVKSKNGFHAYWVVADATNRLELLNVIYAMTARYGSDKALCGASANIRIPGSIHQKKGIETLTQIIEINEGDYTLADLRAEYGAMDSNCWESFKSSSDSDLPNELDISWWDGERNGHLLSYISAWETARKHVEVLPPDMQALVLAQINYRLSSKDLQTIKKNIETMISAMLVSVALGDLSFQVEYSKFQTTVNLSCNKTPWGKWFYFKQQNADICEELSTLRKSLVTYNGIISDVKFERAEGFYGRSQDQIEAYELQQFVAEQRIAETTEAISDLLKSSIKYQDLTFEQGLIGQAQMQVEVKTELSSRVSTLSGELIVTNAKTRQELTVAEWYEEMRSQGIETIPTYAVECHEHSNSGGANASLMLLQDGAGIRQHCFVCAGQDKKNLFYYDPNKLVELPKFRRVKINLKADHDPNDIYMPSFDPANKGAWNNAVADLARGKSTHIASAMSFFDCGYTFAPTSALAGNLAQVTSCEFYKNLDAVIAEAKVSLCLDSTLRLYNPDPNPRDLLLVFDEYTQQLSRGIKDPNLIPKFFEIINHLRIIVARNNTTVITADAFGTDAELEIFRELLGWIGTIKTISPRIFKPTFVGKVFHDYESKELLDLELLRRLREGKKAVYAVTSRKQGAAMAALVSTIDPTIRVKYISSQAGSGDVDVEVGDEAGDDVLRSHLSALDNDAFCENINIYADKYDLIIYTPKMGSGVSCTIPGFLVFCAFARIPGMDWRSYAQMIARFRVPKEDKIHIWMEEDPETSKRNYLSQTDFAQYWNETRERALKDQYWAITSVEGGEFALHPKRFEQLVIKLLCIQHNNSVAPKKELYEELAYSSQGHIIPITAELIAEQQGVDVDVVLFDADMHRDELKDISKILKDIDNKNFAEAPLISNAENKRLSDELKKRSPSYEESMKKGKHYTAKSLGETALDAESKLTDEAVKLAEKLSAVYTTTHALLGAAGNLKDYRFYHHKNKDRYEKAGRTRTVIDDSLGKIKLMGVTLKLFRVELTSNYPACVEYLDRLEQAQDESSDVTPPIGPTPKLNLAWSQGDALTLEDLAARAGTVYTRTFNQRSHGKYKTIISFEADKAIRLHLKKDNLVGALKYILSGSNIKITSKQSRIDGEVVRKYSLVIDVSEGIANTTAETVMKLSFTNVDDLIPALTPDQLEGFTVNGVSTPFDPSAADVNFLSDPVGQRVTLSEPVKPTPDEIEVSHADAKSFPISEAQNQPLNAHQICTQMLSVFASNDQEDPPEN